MNIVDKDIDTHKHKHYSYICSHYAAALRSNIRLCLDYIPIPNSRLGRGVGSGSGSGGGGGSGYCRGDDDFSFDFLS